MFVFAVLGLKRLAYLRASGLVSSMVSAANSVFSGINFGTNSINTEVRFKTGSIEIVENCSRHHSRQVQCHKQRMLHVGTASIPTTATVYLWSC